MNAQINALLQKKWFIPTGIGILSFSGGLGVGYILGSKLFGKMVVETMNMIEEGGEVIDMFVDDILGPDDITVVEIPTDNVNVPGEGLVIDAEDVVNETRHNVFAENNDDWDMDEEQLSRVNKTIFIINKDEYWENVDDFKQETLTYYSGDDILVDMEDVPIYNYSSVIGNLDFGHGSGDKNVLFVQNNNTKAQYEIIRDNGSYSVEVLGMDNYDELKHSIRKFRMDD